MKNTRIKTTLQKNLRNLIFGLRVSSVNHRTSDFRSRTSHRVIAVFFTLTFLQTLIPNNQLWANNNGPNAPEAASFEPVDATDMVNLLTGDLSYVLPLLNVPSPEGGYPLALAYHAGIAMDQEASWVGLGWNLNPGAINRSVNGYADDYYLEQFNEFFYDRGGSATYYNLSLGYGSIESGVSVGLGLSWGTNRSLGGSVSFGYGLEGSPLSGNVSLGTNGASVGAGYQFKGGMSFGVSASTSGNLGVSAGYTASNDVGISVSANTGGTYGVGVSGPAGKNRNLGLNFSVSQNGVGISGSVTKRENKKVVGGGGTGIQLNFDNTLDQGDYTVKQSGYNIPVIVPTPYGVFSASFGKQKITWFLNKAEQNVISGPLSFNKDMSSVYKVECKAYLFGNRGARVLTSEIENSYALALQTKARLDSEYQCNICRCEIIETAETFMDVNEFPLDNQNYTSLDENNIIFPNTDSYNVQGQGISGNLALKFYENASLFSLAKNHSLFTSSYKIDGKTQPTATEVFTFEDRPEFYFENEFTSYLATSEVILNASLTNSNILDYHTSSNANGLPRRKTGNYIEYFTHKDIQTTSAAVLQARGYIPPANQASIPRPSDDGIAAFTVVSTDGKRYHYSIPVYNYSSVTRTIGTVEGKAEQDAYFDKIQDSPYATHWLLTAVTGPDYIDTNGNRKVDESDYGYWVEFDYGKWSEVYAWKIPYGKDYIDSEDEEGVKTRIEGFKDIYYLDKVKTRTHTAIFSKSLRNDNLSHEWKYSSVDWSNAGSAFTQRFAIPKQQSLKLKQIILLKNEDASTLNKSTGNNSAINPGVVSVKFPNPNGAQKSYSYNLEDSVFDENDIPDQLLDKAIKVIDLRYKTTVGALVRNTPNALSENGRLTLDAVAFKGKSNTNVIPPYNFEYYNYSDFNYDNKNDWGYDDNIPWNWSLKKIITPEGGNIQMTYESDDFHKPAFKVGRLFSRQLQFTFLDAPPPGGGNPLSAPKSKIRIKIEVDPEDPFAADIQLSDYFDPNQKFFMDLWYSAVYNGNSSGYDRSSVDIREQEATITEFNTAGNYMIVEVMASSPYFRDAFQFDASPVSAIHGGEKFYLFGNKLWRFGKNQKKPRYDLAWRANGDGRGYSLSFKVVGNKTIIDQKEGDIRVKELNITDGVHNYKTKYYYNQDGFNEDPNNSQYRSSGTLSYIPNDKNLPIPYAAELPAPKVMYQKVNVVNTDNRGVKVGNTQYTFNVLPEKDNNAIKFGEFFEIETQENTYYNNSAQKEVKIRKSTVHDNLSAIGQLIELKSYNKAGQLMSKVKNEYFSRSNRPSNQGIDQESFQSYKELDYNDDVFNDRWLIGASTRINYSQALKRTETSTGSFDIVTTYDKYDDVSGATLETSSFLSDQTQVKSVVVPAYTKYSGMGSMVDNGTNKNMMSQSAGNRTQIKIGNTWKTIAANITTWNNNWTYRNYNGSVSSSSSDNIWRKHKTYIWDGDINTDGTYSGYTGDFDGFKWGVNTTQTNPKWLNTSTVDLYDHYSMALQTTDINDNHVATKMIDQQTKVGTVGNAAYGELFFYGAEYLNSDYLLDQVIGAAYVNSSKAHTGKKSLRLSSGNKGFQITLTSGNHRAGRYKTSVWVDKANANKARISIKGTLKAFNGEQISAGNWTLLNHYEELSSGNETIYITASGGTIYADDFRIHPVESSMTSYVYNEWDELSYMLGANNLAIKYEYDKTGKLRKTYSEVVDAPGVTGGFKQTKEINYNYKKVAQVDADNNGEIDPIESYPPLGLGLYIDSATDFNTNAVANGIGGSGSYQYRWVVSENPIGTNPTYSNWGSSNTQAIYSACGEITYVRCQVKDIETDGISTRNTSRTRACNGNDGDILTPSPNNP